MSIRWRITRVRAAVFLAAALVGFVFALPSETKASGSSGHADMVLLNGKVITVDKAFSVKQAVAVRNGKIVSVGTTGTVKRLVGPNTKVIDLQGRVLLPGINDAHSHVNSLGSSRPPLAVELGFPAVKSIADAVAATEAKVKTVPAGKWIRGGGWNPAFLEECKADPKRQPTRWDLDKVSPDNPVMFTDFSFHNAWVNSKALEMAKITKDTPNPPGGIIERDEKGEPTGILRENASFMLEASLPPLTKEERKGALLGGMKEMNRYGITSYTQPIFGAYEEEAAVYQELCKNGEMTARVTAMLGFGSNFKDLKANIDKWVAPRGLDSDWLQFPQAKVFADGIPPTKTAWMWEPYAGGGVGSLTIAADSDQAKYGNLLEMIAYAHKKGWQIGIHATGDRAISSVLDGYQAAQRAYPKRKDMRHYIIHSEFINAADIKRSARLGVISCMQPFIAQLGADGSAGLVGPERAAREWPFKSVVTSGAKLTFSSDAPIIPCDWRKGMQAAVLREGFSGNVVGPKERVSRKEAIQAYTINGAYQDHKERVKGSIEVGKLADFCILDKDIMTVEAHEIGNVPVVATIAGGRVVYEAEGFRDAKK
jgi:predicted amidohydrolase YtcJ